MRGLQWALLGICACLSACDSAPAGAEQPRNEAFLLVDLSETWNNPTYVTRNQRTLDEIGGGLSLAADTLEPPYLIQYRIIGSASYEREPVCDVEYVPSLVSSGKGNLRRVTRLSKLREYLTDCARLVLAKPAEAQTEISAALRSVADQPKAQGAARKVIIASDFLEESVGQVRFSSGSFAGTDVLLLYRPLAADQVRPADTIRRVDSWRERLERAGAHVQVMPDTTLRRSQVAAFMTTKQ